jgi:general transcription factor 3C polypeptide 3 (transcription factor C subunit 4)
MLQNATNRKNQHKGHSAVVAMSWLKVYADLRSPAHAQEVAFNTGRAYHHLGLKHLAAAYYVQALRLGERGPGAASAGTGGRTDAEDEQDLTMEAARNLACICMDTGENALAEQIVRTFMTI